jgi:MinD-like ATPase involved in chromosome partitioning or flagellar assembly
MYVITFYSFKGGVGRTMALMNAAAELSSRGKRVLVVDFDLEAPGLQSYEPFADAASAGIVDYVTNYIQSRTAPDVSEYIVKCSVEDLPIWFMPAGARDETYAHRLNTIDWFALYTECDGFLMFEDLKQQWSDLNFDYVLIDSRTGHTDVGGICTRQLPDAAVLMFFPNNQDISGMEEIVRNIRLEGDGPREKKIAVHFCPSNVPDLDDDEQILQRHLEDAMRRLNYESPASIIHHYQSMLLLDQPIFVLARPKTRLAQEYRSLVDNVVADNIEDKAGALTKLEQIRTEIRAKRGVHNLSELEDTLGKMYTSHKQDGEVAWSLSLVYEMIGNTEAQLDTLGIAIDKHINEPRARSRRANLLRRDNQADLARDDLRAIILMRETLSADLISAIERLSDVDTEWLRTVERAESLHKLRGKDLNRVASALMVDRPGAAFAAKLLAQANEQDYVSTNTRILALIGTGDYKSAIRLIGDRGIVLRSTAIESVFNLACAEWGLTGNPPRDLFERVLELSQSDRRPKDPNFLQCLAMSYYLLGDDIKAKELVVNARRAIANSPPARNFSAWRYLNVDRIEFRSDIDEIRNQMELKGALVPRWRAALPM